MEGPPDLPLDDPLCGTTPPHEDGLKWPHRDSLAVARESSPPARVKLELRPAVGTCDAVRIPAFSPLKVLDRRPSLPFSIVAQMDSLVYSLLGVRLERDVLCPRGEQSFFEFTGLAPRESLSSFCGFYMTALEGMPDVVAAILSHLACGLVVVPPITDAPLTVLSKSKGRSKTWLEWLSDDDTKLLEFLLPRGCRAFFVSAGSAWKFKSKRRIEKMFTLHDVPLLSFRSPCKIGVLPVPLTRSSPMASEMSPSPSSDVSPDGGPLTDLPDVNPPLPPHNWEVDLFHQWSSDFPDPLVRQIADQSVSEGLDPGFVGQMSKSVVRPNSRTIEGREMTLRAELMEECGSGRMAGPYSRPPFKFCRTIPLSMVKKKKYDPLSDLMRIISNFSSGRAYDDGPSPAVNDLCFSPHLIGFHLRPFHLRDLICSKGPGVTVWAADIPKCFRSQKNLKRLLPLFVYLLETKSFGLEWFIDLCNPFGWTPSEYGWQCILAVLLWRLLKDGVIDLWAFVDNFFRLFGVGEDKAKEVALITTRLESVGVKLHEIQEGVVFKGLGWIWDLEGMHMKCAPDKFEAFSGLLAEWAGRSPLKMSLPEVRTAVGLMVWVSAAFQIGAAGVAALVSQRTVLEGVASRKRLRAEQVSTVLSQEAAETLLFWASHFPLWDGLYPISMGFTPVSSWEVLGQCDASTEWGCGGLLFDGQRLLGFRHEWTPEERARAFVVKRESTGVLELIGARRWMDLFAPHCRGKRIQLEMDNVSAVRALVRLFSPRPEMMESVRRVRQSLFDLRAPIRVVHVLGRFIAVADLLSHNRLEEARCRAMTDFGVDLHLV